MAKRVLPSGGFFNGTLVKPILLIFSYKANMCRTDHMGKESVIDATIILQGIVAFFADLCRSHLSVELRRYLYYSSGDIAQLITVVPFLLSPCKILALEVVLVVLA